MYDYNNIICEKKKLENIRQGSSYVVFDIIKKILKIITKVFFMQLKLQFVWLR